MVSMNSVTDLNECPDIQGFTGIKAAGYCVYDLQRKYFNYETLYDYADRRETTHAKALENLETHAQSALGGSSYRAKAQSTCQSLGLRMPSDSELVSICKTYMFQAGHFMSTSNTEMVSFPSCEVVGAINAYNFTLCIK
ncbi:hypothetical protein IJ541_00050 [bacterium]|nr:hypothetical protein [bacterium]